jgi:hypothetical protein
MRTTYKMGFLLLLSPITAANAQRADTSSARADSLRQQIEERFASRAQEQLKLTNDQTAKLRATSQQFGAKRGQLRSQAQRLRMALEGQLQPGVAANQDSVAKLTDAMIGLRLAEAQLSRDEVKDQAKYLNPVQRAQLYVMRERFAHRLREVHGHGGEMGWRNGPHRGEMDREHSGGRQRTHEAPQAQQDSGGKS